MDIIITIRCSEEASVSVVKSVDEESQSSNVHPYFKDEE
jgi:hypothetical protein